MVQEAYFAQGAEEVEIVTYSCYTNGEALCASPFKFK
jgi:hypothetical protein